MRSESIKLTPIGDSSIRVSDGNYSSKYPKSHEFLESGVPFISANNLRNGRVVNGNMKFISAEQHSTLKKGHLRAGDVLLVTRGSLGTAAYVTKEFENANINAQLVLLRADNETVDSRYLFQVVNSSGFQAQVASNATGTAQPQLPVGPLKRLTIPLPSIETQRKIAGILSAYDDLIENNLRRIKILEQMAQSLYREWFVHFRFPGHESATFKDSELGRIPEGWEVKSIGNFGNVLTGKTPSKANEDFYGEDIPFLKTPDMHGQMFILGTNEYLSTLGAQSQAKKTLPVGSICVSCIGTIGVVSITTEPCQTNQQINSVALHDETSREFLFFWLREAKQLLENLGSNGATMGNVNKSKFEGMKLIRPSSEDLAKYHKYAEPMFCQLELLLREIQTLRSTRDLLLPKLLSK